MLIERLIGNFADVFAGDDAQVAQFDAVIAHGHRFKERGTDIGTPILIHAAVQPHIYTAVTRKLQHFQSFVFHAHAVLIDEVRNNHSASGDLRQLDGFL